MKTTYKPFARKFRQFNHQAKKIKRLHDQGKFDSLSKSRRLELINKLKKMYLELRGKLQHWRLKKTLVGLSFLLLGVGTVPQANAQMYSTPEVNPFGISSNPYSYNFIDFADIDNDGDLDLFEVDLGSGYGSSSSISFYQNDGTAEAPIFGNPVSNPFGVQINAFGINPVITDIDNDGDFDLFIGASDGNYNGDILFYENQGTASVPSFGPAQTNPFGISSSGSSYFIIPAFADLDGDGDQDIIASEVGNLIYFENTGSAEVPAFAAPINVPFGITAPPGLLTFMDFADLDNDGDLDLMAGGFYDAYTDLSSFYYLENIGTSTSPDFYDIVESSFGLVPFESLLSQPCFADIDNDGDLDIFSSVAYSGVAHFENTGAAPTSGFAMVETFISTPYSFSEDDFPFSDQDGDDFKSVKITGLTSIGTLQYDGIEVVNDQVILVSNLPLLIFTPIDNEEGAPYDAFTFQVGDDGDIFSSDHTMTISVGGVSTKDNLLKASLDVFPNPTTSLIQLNVTAVNTLNDVQIKLIDKSGRIIALQSTTIGTNEWQQQFDVSSLAAGPYYIQIDSEGKTTSTQFVKK